MQKNMAKLTDSKTRIIAKIISKNYTGHLNRILVVGCGSGVEAAILADELNAEVTGIDLIDNFDTEASKYATLKTGDATSLNFEDGAFDLIYSYHALEHIKNPLEALKEMNRVLRISGGYWIGTPNRSRLVGYLGSKDATWKQKLKWNLSDWKTRIKGKFRNEFGAHAGFFSWELGSFLRETFFDTKDITNIYYLEMYKRHTSLINIIIHLNLRKFLFPAVYFMGIKLEEKRNV
ncbi:MAG: class I SAM-dependent methyltransferase [Candidatus Hodarchaeota archaeon]